MSAVTTTPEVCSALSLDNNSPILREKKKNAVYFSVLQCTAMHCSALQCIAVCCSVLQCIAECIAVYCSVLQYIAVSVVTITFGGMLCV